MPRPVDQLEAEVLELPAEERVRLLDRLIVSLGTDPAVEAAWVEVARQRDRELDNGEVEAVALDDVLARLRASLR